MIKALILSVLVLFAAGCSDRPTTSITLTPEEKQYVENAVVKVGIETSYPPFIYLDEAGEITGISKNALDEVSKRTGLRFEYVKIGDLKDVLVEFKKGSIQMITSVKVTSERLKYMNFSRSYFTIGSTLLLQELPAKFPLQVGYSEGYAVQELLIGLGKQVDLVKFKNDEEVFEALVAGKIGGGVFDIGSAKYLERKFNRTFLRSDVSFSYELSFAFQKSDETLGSILDKAVKDINTYAPLIQQDSPIK